LQAINCAAFEGEQVNLVIEDYQLTDVSFLDMINSLLASGEVPGLYASDELESLMVTLRELASQDGFIGSLTAYFAESMRKYRLCDLVFHRKLISGVRNNLHLVLVMDSGDPDLIHNCESNPAIYKYCSIQWCDFWSEESMTSILQQKLSG
jgi:dynein heavy chain 2, cytosolic